MAVQAQDVLTGVDAKVFLDGEEIGTWTNFEATVTINYDDVIVGNDVDRQEVSRQGDGSISHQVTNSIGVELFNKLKANRNRRFEIEGEITQGSTGKTQSMTIPGITFDSIPLAAWGKGELVASEMSFRFPPSKVQFPQIIS